MLEEKTNSTTPDLTIVEYSLLVVYRWTSVMYSPSIEPGLTVTPEYPLLSTFGKVVASFALLTNSMSVTHAPLPARNPTRVRDILHVINGVHVIIRALTAPLRAKNP